MNQEIQNKQKWIKIGIISLVMVFFLGASAYILFDSAKSKEASTTYTSMAHLPMDGIDPKEIWVDKIRSENEIVHGKVDFMQQMMMSQFQEEQEKNQSAQNQLGTIHSELADLREEIKRTKTMEGLRSELQKTASPFFEGREDPFVNAPPPEMVVPLTFVSCPEPTNLRHVKRSIPAGTTVRAILLSSVDMPCGVQGNADPLPVKLRLIADGYLPKHVRALLKGGIITASVYGDLSSERVYFRLEKLSQVRADGHFIETQVAGYVSGQDGKYGLRGVVVDKSTKLIENALLSGFLSGASNFFEAAAVARLSPNCCFSGEGDLATGRPLNWGQTGGQLAVAGASGGATNALDALTEYFIKRAEQLRPVIQITAGQLIDVTFSDGADLGDLHTHERVRSSGGKRCGS